MSIKGALLKAYFSQREVSIDYFRRHPIEVQEQMLHYLLHRGCDTEFGERYNLRNIRTAEQFRTSVETFDYDTYRPFRERMLEGHRNVTTRGRVSLFAKSSGTTSDRSKYIPVTRESLWHHHTLGMRDVATLFSAAHPGSKALEGKTLTLGGVCHREGANLVGDLSAVLIHETPVWSGWFRAPRTQTAILDNFEQKCDRICRECVGERITAFAGVPSWNLMLMRWVLEYTGKNNLLEVWPELTLFAHGGVEFAPYRTSFEKLLPSPDMHYMETYNASEGFFAIADDPAREDMLLMLDYGTYYEFRRGSEIVPLEGVTVGGVYALLISSNNGLWRYEIGDQVEFTSTNPYRIRFAGRTQQYLNVFGEELIVANTDKALSIACQRTGAVVEEYTVAPCFMSLDVRGAHEWIVEFVTSPNQGTHFGVELDRALRELNSDYDAKRTSTLDPLRITVVPRGTFMKWLRARGKNKVPRLTNDRKVAEEIMMIKL
ncbi:MAG: GH3 auxin-responsive promoter family protein [Alistipes sp.]